MLVLSSAASCGWIFLELLVSDGDRSRPLQDKNIFILAGQSNMAGRGGVVNEVWDGIIPAECASIIRFNSHRKWMDSSNIGVIGLVPCAVGGTSISEWSRGVPLYNLRAVLWYQGESDTVYQKDAESYGHNLKQLISNVREDLHLPRLHFILVALASGEGPFVGIVRKAQLEIDLLNVLTVDADGRTPSRTRHLTTEAQVRLGHDASGGVFR
ncbi:hypothetical protein MKW94_005383 [Papaver nudicaule]|uniref:Sialate O-acetylesterase domain-containing protein n=1 Tax=Papaver nudicaule TaxID=74823 RepID=A0AA41RWB2_PAPNU|nr:hypothetical protein [Papaver nudicaule]